MSHKKQSSQETHLCRFFIPVASVADQISRKSFSKNGDLRRNTRALPHMSNAGMERGDSLENSVVFEFMAGTSEESSTQSRELPI